MAYNTSSRTGPTHSHQWFMDSVEVELFPKQKQVVDVTNSSSLSGFLTSSISGGETSSTFHPVASQFGERLFDTQIARTINFGERNLSSGELGNIMMQRKRIEDSVESDFSFGLSISNSLEDPRTGLNHGGIKRVKVSQVKDRENLIPSFFQTYNREDSSSLSVPHAFGKTDDNSVSMGLSFSKEDNCMMSIGNSFVREDSNFIAMDQTHTNGGTEDTLIGPGYNDPSSIVSLNETLNKDECNIAKGAQTFESFDRTNLAVSQSLKMNNSAVSIGLPSSLDGCNIVPIGQTFNKGAEIAAYMDHTYNKTEDNSISMSKIYNKLDDNDLSIAHTCGKGESKIISFGGTAAADDINASEKLICSYDLLMGQSSVQKSEIGKGTMSIESKGDALIKATQITTTNIIFPKKREDQKVARKQTPNNFPSNVRSLLSTGILDGVPVKYIAWSQEKELRGAIKGSGYLCCCESCNYSKVINAYEFERHAGCKTKHPNNHIYFENGKTIYGIVQELRNTPQNILFDVIQTITGSPINQKSFRLWKESFLAATRELQRIYGTEEGKQLS